MRNFDPKSRDFNERPITRPQGDIEAAPSFEGGVYNDLPASNVPTNGLYWSENYLVFPLRLEPRSGSKVWSDTTLPTIAGRTSGADFTSEDVGKFVVFSDGARDKITAVASTTSITLESERTYVQGEFSAMTEQVNGYKFHKKKRLHVLHIGTKIYTADVNITAWTEVSRRGNRAGNNISSMREYQDFMIIGNTGGIFRVDLSGTPYTYWQMNGEAPGTLVSDVAKTNEKIYGYKYLYKMSYISGTSILRDRFGQYDTSGNTVSTTVIKQESAPNKINKSNKDYGTFYADNRVGEAGTTYGKLVGGALGASYDTPSEWKVIADGQFRISIDGTSKNIQCDFTGVTSMAMVADIIQLRLRDQFIYSFPTCVYDTDHFEIESPLEGGAITVVSDGDGGTDIGGAPNYALQLDSTNGTASTPTFSSPITVSRLYVPQNAQNKQNAQHWTHYSLYRTLDVGVKGINPISGAGNSSEDFMWVADIPAAKAFVASRATNQVVAIAGYFEQADVGALIRFADGTEDTISAYTDATHVTTTGTGTVSEQAAAIGGATTDSVWRVMTASQTSTTVTRTAGGSFYESDIGKVLFWANGVSTVITGYTNANTVSATSASIPSTGVTINPTSRTYYDTTRDDYVGTDTTIITLRDRMADSAYWLQDRFHVPLPDCNIIEIVNAFMFGAVRDQDRVYYSAVPEYRQYFLGNYNPGKQYAIFEDKIKTTAKVQDALSVFCSNSTHVLPTNNYIEDKNIDTGQITFIVSGQYVKDNQLGVLDWGSLAKISDDLVQVRTNDNGMRQFDGLRYSTDLSHNRIFRKLSALDTTSTGGYHPAKGYWIWSKDSKDTSEQAGNRVIKWYDKPDATALRRSKPRNDFIKKSVPTVST